LGAENKRHGPCEAEVHVEGCSGIGCTKDHFTPKSIAREVLGWRNRQINAEENIQYLSRECHEEKDRTTPDRLNALRAQEQGGEIRLNDVRRWAGKSDYNQA